ncbi:hypothetical protein EYZ11_007203 [Aspergillus tanneri]|uniref:FAD-binding PCMH-type domain-containing protein n=1 Tax=Aspergillus tanneri TaxID=1220188 RepID=A0A4V3UP15_9EURO|nr:uncharacterized protein ATNIH1004_001734 [Aspergillus tanneri]KAA8652825.1 hypothetical protein ATNIH1004_001734 [Aspergillus tanneri]THC93314.1 hypothetical protein EYZ11_007203 [Aspergillus tanneri]
MVDIEVIKTTFQDAVPGVPFFVRGDVDYSSKVATWNTLAQPRPLAVAQPASPTEVSAVIAIANSHAIPHLAIRGGGHSFEALSLGGVDGALVIDVINMNKIHSDPEHNEITAGGVGIGGQIQCGGYGFCTRTFGTLVDRVLSMEVVTADGEIRTVNDKQNTVVGTFLIRWSLDKDDIPTILKQLHNACVSGSTKLNPMIIIWLGCLEVAGVILADTEAERESIWNDLRKNVPKSREAKIKPMDFIDTVWGIGLTQTSAPWCASNSELKREGEEHLRYMKIKAGFISKLMDDKFLEQLAALAVTQPRSGVRVQLLGLDPACMPAQDTTSVKTGEYGGDRGVTVDEGEKRRPWLTTAYELFYPLTAGGYIGDDDIEETVNGRDMMESYYGQHLARLREVKSKYDPRNIFHHPLSIPPGEA